MNRHRCSIPTGGPADGFACETEPRVSSTLGDAARVAYRGQILGNTTHQRGRWQVPWRHATGPRILADETCPSAGGDVA